MVSDKEIEAARDSIRELSGGHSLANTEGDYLWQTKYPINITKLLEAAEKVRSEEEKPYIGYQHQELYREDK